MKTIALLILALTPLVSTARTVKVIVDYPVGWTSVFDSSELSKAQTVAKAMGIVETGGIPKKGASGEMKTIWQWLPATWDRISSRYNKEVFGLKGPLSLNTATEESVVIWKCEKFLEKGYTPHEIGRIWNTSLGGAERPFIRRGVNKHGICYDSWAHGEKVAKVFRSL